MKLCADGTKLYRMIQDSSDSQAIQDDLMMLCDWSDKWLLKFNLEKCTVMHCGPSNPRITYYMKQEGGQLYPLAETTLEKDLGVHHRWARSVPPFLRYVTPLQFSGTEERTRYILKSVTDQVTSVTLAVRSPVTI